MSVTDPESPTQTVTTGTFCLIVIVTALADINGDTRQMAIPHDPNQPYPQQPFSGQPAGGQPYPGPPYGQQPPQQSTKKKRKWPWILLAIVAFFLVVGVATGGNGEDGNTAAQGTSSAAPAPGVAQVPVEEVTAASETVAAEPEAPAISVAQQNAVRSAENYLRVSAFSREGLIDQLVYESYSVEDATYAVDSISPDWNEQAAEKAQTYLDLTGFSRQGLIDQLVFDGFTPAEATFGADQAGL